MDDYGLPGLVSIEDVVPNSWEFPGWVYDWKHRTYCWPHRIDTEFIVSDGKVYRLPEQLVGQLWVEDITVAVRKNIGAQYLMYEVTSKGFNPHRDNGYYARANISKQRYLCTGHTDFRKLSEIRKFPEMFRYTESCDELTDILTGEKHTSGYQQYNDGDPIVTRTRKMFEKHKEYIKNASPLYDVFP
jgi:hypothetical protein